MRISVKKIILFISTILVSNFINAQEVFNNDGNGNIQSYKPSYYYPIRNQNLLEEFITKDPTNNLIATGAHRTVDRFGNMQDGMGMDREEQYVRMPPKPFEDMAKNKIFNMSFWVQYTEDVYNGSKEGILFSVRKKAEETREVVYCRIVNKKIMVYGVRKKIDGTEVNVPLIKIDFPIDWSGTEGSNPGSETNGYIFFCITTENTSNGKRTNIYFSRPGGRLYCRSYYVDVFEHVSATDDFLVIGGGWNGSVARRMLRLDDIMLYTNGVYSTRRLTSDEVLNNFYRQSPLYEGISYGFEGRYKNEEGRFTTNVLSLESIRRSGVPLTKEYIIGTTSHNYPPFSSQSFMVIKKPDFSMQTYKITSAKMGGFLHPNISWYAYMETDSENDSYEYFKYQRDVSNPEDMYAVFHWEFKLYNAENQRYLSLYNNGTKPYLSYYNGGAPEERTFSLQNAYKVDRGAERMYKGEVTLRNHAYKPEGEYIASKTSSLPDFMGIGWGGSRKIMMQDYQKAATGFMTNTYMFKGVPGELGFYSDCQNVYEGDALQVVDNAVGCKFHFMYYKDDVNGKPLYIMRQDKKVGTNPIFSGLFIGARANGQPDIEQNYKDNALNGNGTVPDKLLWSIHKAD